jgi:Protein of unknown function DUF262
VTLSTTPAERRKELSEQRRKVDFDTYDVTADELLRRVASSRIDIAPVYQRQFRWDTRRQSRLIESVLLGIPVPPLFMATNQGDEVRGSWEVVDGLQRLLTLVNFAGSPEAREITGLTSEPLRLQGMDKLPSFDGCAMRELPEDIQSALEDRPLKVIVLNDKSELQVRFDLFERLNTGGISLSPQEIRECVYRGSFMDLLGVLARSLDFQKVVVLPNNKWHDGTPEEFVLRFFAYSERYEKFEHLVSDFLRDFTEDAYAEPRIDGRSSYFHRTFHFLARCFPDGLKTRSGATPVNLFEAVSAGAALALDTAPELEVPTDLEWVGSDELRQFTTGGTNSRRRVLGRIQYCRDKFIHGND